MASERFGSTRYELIERIGEGGMGELYKVRHPDLDQFRVLKVIHASLADKEEYRERFVQEARTAILLNHENVVKIFDYEVPPDGRPLIVMEHLEGETLRRYLDRRRAELRPAPELWQALEIGYQVLLALDHLHGKNIVHRDVSPENLMLIGTADGLQVKLIDLGIAKPLRDENGLTSPGAFVGKSRYASPEQFKKDARIDSRSDIYSFGVLFYELLTGVYPIQGETFEELGEGHLRLPPRGFDDTDPEGRVPETLRELVTRALEKDPERRFPDAESLARRLRAIQKELTQPDGQVPAPDLPPPGDDPAGRATEPSGPRAGRRTGLAWRPSRRLAAALLVPAAGLAVLRAQLRPAAPELVSPDGSVPIQVARPELGWTCEDEVGSSRLEVWSINDHRDVFDDVVEASPFTLPVELPVGAYHWRVACRRYLISGPFSEYGRFVVDTALPEAPEARPAAHDPTAELPELRWRCVEDAASYRVEVASSESFAPDDVRSFEVDGACEAGYRLDPTLVADEGERTLHWRVFSLDGAGNLSASAGTGEVTVDRRAPGRPALREPFGAQSSRRPVFRWDAAPDAVRYEVQVATDDAFRDALRFTPEPGALTWTPARDLPDGVLHWRVVAVDRVGHEAPSNPGTLAIDTTPPPVPYVVPARSDDEPRRPRLEWRPVTEAVGYVVQVATDAAFATLVADRRVDGTSFRPDAPLGAPGRETAYWWRVGAVDAAGNRSAFSAAERRVVDLEAPTAPVLEPAEVHTRERRPALGWRPSTGTDHYHLRVVDEDGGEVSTAEVRTSTVRPAVDLGAEGGETTYFWRVTACDTSRNCLPSDEGRIVIDRRAPRPPTLDERGDHSYLAGKALPFALSWQAADGATAYRLTLSRRLGAACPAGESPFLALDLETNRLAPAWQLPDGDYCWCVAAVDDAGNASEPRCDGFAIDSTPPPRPVLRPLDVTRETRPTLRWWPADGADRYRIEIATAASFEPGVLAISDTPRDFSFVPARDLPIGPSQERELFWRVASVDRLGNPSPFSVPGSFVVDRRPPPPPSHLYVDERPYPLFEWDPVADAAAYLVRVYEDDEQIWEKLIRADASLEVVSLRCPNELPEGDDYSWSVTAIDGAGNRSEPTLGAFEVE